MQDVDKWDADVAALLEAFKFLPRWRIDDIMVSFAATGGSGPTGRVTSIAPGRSVSVIGTLSS